MAWEPPQGGSILHVLFKFWVWPLPGVLAGFDMNNTKWIWALTTLVAVFRFDFFSSEHWFSQCRRLLSHFYGTFCVLSHYTSLPLVRLLQLPAVQCCCNFLTDFGWKGRLVSIPMVDRDRIFLSYLLYHCFPILVRCCHMPVWLEGYMPICWVRLERLAHG